MIRVRVLFFASLRERAKVGEAEHAMAVGASVGDLWKSLTAAYPAIEPMSPSVSFAVNREYADRAQVLRDGDEVALIPPVSGGS